MRLSELAAVSRSVAGTSGRLEKIDRLASLLTRLGPDEIDVAISFLIGTPRQGRIGVAGAAIAEARAQTPADTPTLDLRDVDRAFASIAAAAGKGSAGDRTRLLRDLLSRATADEQDFLVRLLFGELRQGALEGVLLEAVAKAAGLSAAPVRRAAMFAGSLPEVGRVALVAGGDALTRFTLRPFQPVQPMLADSAADVDDAIAVLGEASLEYKLDGARVQIHKKEDDVRVFSRSLRDVTAAVPDIVEVVRALPARELVLDGEAIALRPDGIPRPFQETMRRFGRRLDVERLRYDLPMTPVFFDVLYLDGQPLVDEPLTRRSSALADLVEPGNLIPRLVTSSAAEAEAFFSRALAAGHEGVLAKALAAPYAAGRRGQAWLKVKRARTLDVVVLAAEWGHGRRKGFLSNLHLGARSGDGGFVMLGKTFKGLTDEMLAWQTKALLEIEVARDAYAVYVKPELVVEVAFNEIQESSQYQGGLTLRFARVKRYRPDKSARDANTIADVRALASQIAGL